MPPAKDVAMFLFETILFFNEAPSYYKVYQQASRYFFEASPVDYYKNISFPNFYLTESGKTWQTEGCNNQSLIEQAIEELSKFAYTYKAETSL